MAGSIRTCPACKTLLLRDTVQCPECDHVFDEERHRQLEQTKTGQGRADSGPAEDTCPTCEERVRHGMVRCWNCGSFMQEEIAALYMKMQAKPAPVIYSHVPGSEDSDEIYDVEDPGDAVFSDDEDESPSAEDDFELAADVSSRQTSVEESSTYSIAGNATTPTEPTESTNGAAAKETAAEDAPAEEPAAEASTADAATDDEKESGPADEETKPKSDEAAEDSAEAHSIATGGDALLQIAMEEELETDKRKKRPGKKQQAGRAITGFLVYCANGHRIEVQDRHRGKAGRCPRCKTLFIVPEKTPEPETTAAADTEGGEGEAGDKSQAAGRFTRWMSDVRLHKVNPEKLRLKPGSLEKSFQLIDIGFSPEDVLIASLPAAKGFLGMSSAGGGSNDEAREALLTSLREETPFDDIPAEEKRLLAKDALQQLAIDQPVVYEHESMFVGIPVFGSGRIAVRLPKENAKDFPTFLSFDLSTFRELSQNLDELYGIEEFGLLNEIPLEDEFTEQTCHYSEEKFRTVENHEFYEADEKSTLKLVGRKCEACGLVVSEDSRKKEKIGGANGKSIAKAKCPKCEKKFGDISLFDLEAAPDAPADSEAETSAETADEESTAASK